MKHPLPELSFSLIILTLFFPLNNIPEVLSVGDDIRDDEADTVEHLWHDDQEFSAPWLDDHEYNKENFDYNYYKEHVQDFETGPEDIPEEDSEDVDIGGDAADFQSNYGDVVGDDDDESVENQDEGDKIVGGERDIDGNVQWTTL